MRVASAPVVAVDVWYRVGSKDEPRDRRGMAHMIELLMSEGSERVRPRRQARFIHRLGGYSNTATSEDATWYSNVVPRSYLDFVCQLEAERMRKLLFRDAAIEVVRQTVREETRLQDSDPLARAFLRFLELAYSKHPYAWMTRNASHDLDAITAADLERFYNAYYVPQNAMLVVVGDVTREQVEQAAKNFFGVIPRGQEPPRPADALAEPAQTSARREVTDARPLGVILAGVPIPAARHADIPALQVASMLLGGGGDAPRLHRRLVEAETLAVQIAAPILVREHPGMLGVLAAYVDPAGTAKLEAGLVDELTALARTPVAPAELAKARSHLMAALAFGLEDARSIARQIGDSWIATGDPAHWRGALDRFAAVTAADIKRVAQTYFKPESLTIVVVPPAGSAPRN
jgi:zinc protease